MDEIFLHIRRAFDSLWKIRPRGNSFEVITPFPAAGDKYVSVFITVQNGKYIVTDGGWVSDGVYTIDKECPDLSKTSERILNYFIEDFGISRTKTQSGRIICFKSVLDGTFIPNIVFDVANFVSIISSTAIVPMKEEIENRNTFKKRASKFLIDKVGSQRIRSNEALTEAIPAAKFNAIISMPSKKSTLINFITGSTKDYMVNCYCKSNTMFDFLTQTAHGIDVDSLVEDKIVFMDDSAKGYREAHLQPYLEMSAAKGQKILIWSKDRLELSKIIA